MSDAFVCIFFGSWWLRGRDGAMSQSCDGFAMSDFAIIAFFAFQLRCLRVRRPGFLVASWLRRFEGAMTSPPQRMIPRSGGLFRSSSASIRGCSISTTPPLARRRRWWPMRPSTIAKSSMLFHHGGCGAVGRKSRSAGSKTTTPAICRRSSASGSPSTSSNSWDLNADRAEF